MNPDEMPRSDAETPSLPAGSSPLRNREISVALAELGGLQRARKLTPEAAMRLAKEAAAAFLERLDAAGGYERDAITLLCDLATLDDPSLARAGLHGLFPLLIEHLGDAFTPEACAAYDRLFVQAIQHCRKLPKGAALDHQLRYFRLFTEADLLMRAAHVRQPKRFDSAKRRRISKVFVLSRVTLGADVAVTSVALAAMKATFPAAEVRLVANTKALQLFAGDPRIQLCAVEYPRGGGLIERLASWQQTVESLKQHLRGLTPEEYVIIDPDSRLTQLGLLPLVADERPYFFFESRRYEAVSAQKIGALTSHWLQHVFGHSQPFYPYCAPSQGDIAAAHTMADGIKRQGSGFIVSVNLGVGTNPAKRLPDPFELRLLARLLSDGATVVLDKGGEPEEAARIEGLIAALQGEGFRSAALDDLACGTEVTSAAAGIQLFTWQGSIGRFAALIAASDVYIGYDSAGQHIAAALGLPTIDIFTGFTSHRMPERWAPYGRGLVEMLRLDISETRTLPQIDAIVDRVVSRMPGGYKSSSSS
jgi:ADP-heptose:LPS heptosyltransferase